MANSPSKKQPLDDKWPWSVTDREFGALEQEQKEIRHDLRTLKLNFDACGLSHRTGPQVDEMRGQIIKLRQETMNLNDDIKTLKKTVITLEKFNTEISQFKTKVYTAFSVVILLAGAVAWLTEFVLSIAGNK